MNRYVWLVLLALPPLLAAHFDPPTWVLLAAVVPFFVFAATLGDPAEHLLGEGFAKFRAPVLLLLLVGAVVVGGVLLVVFRAAAPR